MSYPVARALSSCEFTIAFCWGAPDLRRFGPEVLDPAFDGFESLLIDAGLLPGQPIRTI